MDVISAAIDKCPFLHELANQQGRDFARHIAIQPTKPAGTCPARPLLEEVDSFYSTFNLFHGNNGLVPLSKPQHVTPSETHFHGNHGTSTGLPAQPPAPRLQGPPPMFASITMSMGPMPEPGNGRPNQNNKNKGNINKHRGIRNERFRPISASGSGVSGGSSGSCPMRKWLGPVAPYVFNTHGKLQCPEPIIKMRAALARTEPVRKLRPKGIYVKLLTVGATAAIVNVPCGAIREHFEKFSVGWFLAVHASIPFVAMLRKAVVMPKYAIVMTVAAAIAGQVFGSRMERYRLAQMATRSTCTSQAAAVTTAAMQQLQADSNGKHMQCNFQICPLRGAGLMGSSHAQESDCRHASLMFARVGVPLRVA